MKAKAGKKEQAMSRHVTSSYDLSVAFQVWRLKQARRSLAVGKQAVLRVPFRNYLLP